MNGERSLRPGGTMGTMGTGVLNPRPHRLKEYRFRFDGAGRDARLVARSTGYSDSDSDSGRRIDGSDGIKGSVVPCFYAGNGEFAFRLPGDRSDSDAEGIKWLIEFADERAEGRTSGLAGGRECGRETGIRIDGPGEPLGEVLWSGGDEDAWSEIAGGIRRSAKGRFLEHADGSGKPFLWMGDTWWMALTERLGFPEEFCGLADDRKAKGFNVIQIVAGFYPDMGLWDPRGRSARSAQSTRGSESAEIRASGTSARSGGGGVDGLDGVDGLFPIDRETGEICIEFFDEMDKRIAALVARGLIPCIVGCWGYYADSGMPGHELVRRHWRYLVARYAAFPVVWCAAGEALLPWYLDESTADAKEKDRATGERMSFWTDICRMIRAEDPFGRPVTIHPTEFGHEQVYDAENVLDIEMLQTGHGSFGALWPALEKIGKAMRETGLPVVNAEACYEGICGGNEAEVQRFSFWSSIMSGCCGYTYGANGIWQMNRRDRPYGASPHGVSWGDESFEDARVLPGGRQVAGGAVLLRELPWEEFQPHPEWSEKPCGERRHEGELCVGVPGKARVYFRPFAHGFFWNEEIVCGLEPGIVYEAFYFDPIDLRKTVIGEVRGDADGRWRSPRVSAFRDQVLVLFNGRDEVT